MIQNFRAIGCSRDRNLQRPDRLWTDVVETSIVTCANRQCLSPAIVLGLVASYKVEKWSETGQLRGISIPIASPAPSATWDEDALRLIAASVRFDKTMPPPPASPAEAKTRRNVIFAFWVYSLCLYLSNPCPRQ